MKRKSHDFYHDSEKISDTFRKSRLKFHRHILRIGNQRLAERILNLALSMTVNNNWLLEVGKDPQEIGITADIVLDRSKFIKVVDNHRFADHTGTITKKTWSEHRKKSYSEKMKKFWEKKKAITSVK